MNWAVLIGLPCLALALSVPAAPNDLAFGGAGAVANSSAQLDDDCDVDPALCAVNWGDGAPSGGRRKKKQVTIPPTQAPDSASETSETSATSEASTTEPDEPMEDTRWITYLLLFVIALLFLLLAALLTFLTFYILSVRVLNKTTCKEIELQCRCEDCGKDNEDDCG